MRKYLCCALLSLACFSNDVLGMDLSLKDAVNKIMAESNDLRKAEANIKKAEASLDAVNANRWFNIEGTASYMNLVNVEQPGKTVTLPTEVGALVSNVLHQDPNALAIPDNIFMAGISITQPIYTFGKIGNAVDAVKNAIKISKSSHDLTVREVKYSAANLYWTAKMTDEIVTISQKNLNDAITAKKKLTSAGRANRSNLVKIESDIASKEISLSNAKFNRETAYRMLKIMAGINMDEELVLIDKIPDTFEQLQVKTLQHNPEWDILNQQINMYKSQASAKRANGYPTLAATASYSFSEMNADANALFDHSGSQSAYWGVALKVPVFSGGLNRANATVEAMNAEAVAQDLDKSKKLKQEEYSRSIREYNHLCDNLHGLENARGLAEKAYKFSQERFAAGQTSATELADVSSSLYMLNISLVNTKYNILMSEENIKKLGE